MSTAYSNGFGSSSGYIPKKRHSHNPFDVDDLPFTAVLGLYLSNALRSLQRLVLNLRVNGWAILAIMISRISWQVRQNLTARRLISFPHLLILCWVVLLLWGEYWIFGSKVHDCSWESWEDWPSDATPHHLILIADPQLIDPHSYPDRPGPLNDLTVVITDNYMRKGYRQLQSQLQPDSVFFLGDLFDGGREWKTAAGDFSDPKWALNSRPKSEQPYAEEWNKKYGEDYWLSEYARFQDLFLGHWPLGGDKAGSWQRGRKIVASLPGNHDLGFGDEVKVPVRDRFAAYFGEPNRVDIIGNHSIVSVDTVSLSADSSNLVGHADLKPIYSPANDFLDNVQATKRRAAQQELQFWRGEAQGLTQSHKVESIKGAHVDDLPSLDPGDGAGPEFPSILLTHVPLYREAGTPCGPMREHWPPAPKPPGQTEPVKPDPRNAISISKGYQYQNVLSEDDSVKLVKKVGNVAHVFSGDDHDYCEVVHSDSKENVREITVKSISMAMGIPTPGFVMVSMWNPVDKNGKHLADAPEQTMQTHLCLMPNQISTFIKYAIFVVISLAAIVLRAMLMPILGFTPFTLAAADQSSQSASLLPTHKEKKDEGPHGGSHYSTYSATSGTSKHLDPRAAGSRIRSASLTSNGSSLGRSSSNGRSSRSRSGRRWGWAESGGPRIDIYRDDGLYDGSKSRSLWKASSGSSRPRASFGLVVREILACTWRVAWVTLLFFAYLLHRG